MNGALTTQVPLLFGLSVPLEALPVLAFAAAIAVTALVNSVGTLIAILGSLVAPLGLITGLLGGLGLGFVLAAKKALGMHEDGLGQAVSGLKKQFDDLTTTLVGRFMPVFQFLIHNAHDALDFLNRIAKLPLDEAFQKLATQGVPAVTKFLEQVGHMLARPIRLAVQLAFGTGKGANEAQSAISALWKQLNDFLFGYTIRHPVELRPGVFKIKTTTVDGVMQPFLDWFNRHDFSKQGQKIGYTMMQGMLAAVKDAAPGVFHILVQAFHEVVGKIKREWDHLVTELTTAMHRWNSEFEQFVVQAFVSGWNHIKSVAGEAITAIRDHIGNIKSAISGVIGAAKTFWGWLQKIADFFANALTLHINWPSPPGWLTSLGGLIGGGSNPSSNPGAGSGRGAGSHNPGGQVMQVNHFHLSGAGSDAAFRRQVREIGRELGRQHHILAGGQ